MKERAEKNIPIVLPIGSIEGHGAHLPISTDTMIACRVSDELAERKGWTSLPPITYTIAVPARIGNVNVSQETFGCYLKEILQHFIDFGQKRFILILGHGGPDMKNAIGTASRTLCEGGSVSISAFHVLRVLEDLRLVDQGLDRHAGEWETSLMLLMHSDLVGDVEIYGTPEEVKKYSIVGDPKKASEKKGGQYLESVLKKIERDIGTSEPHGFCSNWQ
ncbi:MAG: creatininase family protein [Methanobacteriota archaeon]|nr:MAG: creatininase family protein [Euryarchaeota archaeon]